MTMNEQFVEWFLKKLVAMNPTDQSFLRQINSDPAQAEETLRRNLRWFAKDAQGEIGVAIVIQAEDSAILIEKIKERFANELALLKTRRFVV